jgi:hypothetical protein
MTKIDPTDDEELVERYMNMFYRFNIRKEEKILPPESIVCNSDAPYNLPYGRIYNIS